MKPGRALLILALLAASAALSGCAAAIQPWDRDLLAQPRMSLAPHPMLSAIDDHIYFSKEASTGGADASGGGCGCN
jgi:hypothetical protein